MNLDERGIPITTDEQIAAPHCPPSPCQLCTGMDGTGKLTSWQWCRLVDTCAATVDWDRVYDA